jgi:hypothetical protein
MAEGGWEIDYVNTCNISISNQLFHIGQCLLVILLATVLRDKIISHKVNKKIVMYTQWMNLFQLTD